MWHPKKKTGVVLSRRVRPPPPLRRVNVEEAIKWLSPFYYQTGGSAGRSDGNPDENYVYSQVCVCVDGDTAINNVSSARNFGIVHGRCVVFVCGEGILLSDREEIGILLLLAGRGKKKTQLWIETDREMKKKKNL